MCVCVCVCRFFVRTEDYRDQYMPALANKTMGDNYIRFYENTLFWVQCGSGIMEYITSEVLIVSFGLPAMTNEEFFGEQIVNNLAQFLSVPIEKVRASFISHCLYVKPACLQTTGNK